MATVRDLGTDVAPSMAFDRGLLGLETGFDMLRAFAQGLLPARAADGVAAERTSGGRRGACQPAREVVAADHREDQDGNPIELFEARP